MECDTDDYPGVSVFIRIVQNSGHFTCVCLCVWKCGRPKFLRKYWMLSERKMLGQGKIKTHNLCSAL